MKIPIKITKKAFLIWLNSLPETAEFSSNISECPNAIFLQSLGAENVDCSLSFACFEFKGKKYFSKLPDWLKNTIFQAGFRGYKFNAMRRKEDLGRGYIQQKILGNKFPF